MAKRPALIPFYKPSRTILRHIKKRKQPEERPLQLRQYKFVTPIDVTDDKLVLHRRGPRRQVVGGDPLEQRAAQNIRGTLPERVFYQALVRRRYVPGADFDFQSSLMGGRVFLGGMVADFIFFTRHLVVRVQGWRWHQSLEATRRDDNQRDVMERMGYTVLDVSDTTVLDELLLEQWIRANIDTFRIIGGPFAFSLGVDPLELGLDMATAKELLDKIELLQTRVNTLEAFASPNHLHPHLQISKTNIQDATITNAEIADATITTAKISDVAAGKITTGSLAADQYVQSSNFSTGSAGFKINADGTAEFAQVDARGLITATSGVIGGWTVSGDTLTATGVVLDADNEKITVGSEAPNIIIDGGNKIVKSSNFSEGVSGFALNGANGHAEFQNATVRGLLKTHVTETSVQTSTSGTFIVNDASDVLIAEVAADALTIDVSSNAIKRNGMVYMSPDASRTEWMRVTNSGSAITGGYRYTVSRDLESTGAFAYEAGESIITRGLASVESRPAMWGENEAGVELTESAFTVFGGLDSKYGWGMALWGTKQVNFGGIYDFAQTPFSDGKLCQFGKSTMAFGGTGWSAFGGWVQLEGTATQGPYLSVVRREGPGATDYTAYGRFGKLDGFLDYAGTDDIGIGLGELGDYLSWDKQNGLRIGAGADKTQVTGEYVQMPSVTSTERDALTASNGMMIYNTTTSKMQAREAGSWTNLI